MIEMLQLKTAEQTYERAVHVARQRQEKVVVLKLVEGKACPIYGITPQGALEEVLVDTLRTSFFELIGFQLVETLGWRHKHQRERQQGALASFGTLIDAIEDLVKAGVYIRTKDGLVRAS